MGTRCPGQERGSGPQTVRPARVQSSWEAQQVCRGFLHDRGCRARWRPGTSHHRSERRDGAQQSCHWPGTCGGLGTASWPHSSPRAGTLDQADPRAARGPAGLARAELAGGSSWTGHRGTQRGSWQTACRQRPLALTSDQGLPQRVHHEAEFAKCLLLNNSSLLPRKARSPPLFCG